MKRLILLVAISVVVLSCSKGGEAGVVVDEGVVSELVQIENAVERADVGGDIASADFEGNVTFDAAPTRAAAEPSEPLAADKKIIRTGNIDIRVDDVAKAKSELSALAARYDSYFSQDNYNESELSYDLVIRIPNANFDAFVAALESDRRAKILHKTITANDVTEQWVDIETRLANKRVYLARYQELVRRASTIKEILEVEERIRALEEEIDSAEGRLRYLGNQVAYSTLTLHVSQEVPYTPAARDSAWGRLVGSARIGWQIIVEVFFVVVKLWPLVLAGAITLLVIRYRKRRRKA